jgi:hypothetical protein
MTKKLAVQKMVPAHEMLLANSMQVDAIGDVEVNAVLFLKGRVDKSFCYIQRKFKFF